MEPTPVDVLIIPEPSKPKLRGTGLRPMHVRGRGRVRKRQQYTNSSQGDPLMMPIEDCDVAIEPEAFIFDPQNYRLEWESAEEALRSRKKALDLPPDDDFNEVETNSKAWIIDIMNAYNSPS